jgi:ribosome-binding factor A
MAGKRTKRRVPSTARDYPRTARLNELLREILAEELDRLDDERLSLLTIISVAIEADLRHAVVFYDCLDGEDGDEEALTALSEARVRLQAAIGRQARMKRTPELTFEPDPAIRSGLRIDAILRDIEPELAAADAREQQDPSDELGGSEGPQVQDEGED